MNLNPASQLELFGHHFEFCNFIDLYKDRKLPNKILLSGEKFEHHYLRRARMGRVLPRKLKGPYQISNA